MALAGPTGPRLSAHGGWRSRPGQVADAAGPGGPVDDGSALARWRRRPPAIVLNAEDNARDTIRGRLAAAGADLARVQVWDAQPGQALLRWPQDADRLERRADADPAFRIPLHWLA